MAGAPARIVRLTGSPVVPPTSTSPVRDDHLVGVSPSQAKRRSVTLQSWVVDTETTVRLRATSAKTSIAASLAPTRIAPPIGVEAR